MRDFSRQIRNSRNHSISNDFKNAFLARFVVKIVVEGVHFVSLLDGNLLLRHFDWKTKVSQFQLAVVERSHAAIYSYWSHLSEDFDLRKIWVMRVLLFSTWAHRDIGIFFLGGNMVRPTYQLVTATDEVSISTNPRSFRICTTASQVEWIDLCCSRCVDIAQLLLIFVTAIFVFKLQENGDIAYQMKFLRHSSNTPTISASPSPSLSPFVGTPQFHAYVVSLPKDSNRRFGFIELSSRPNPHMVFLTSGHVFLFTVAWSTLALNPQIYFLTQYYLQP